MTTQIQKFSIVILLLSSMQIFSQVGVGTQNPSSRSILDLTATDKGFLLPRMTTAQRTAIAPNNTTDRGMQVYDTDTLSIWFWNGTAWVQNGAKNIYDSNGDIAPTTATNRTVSFTNGGSLNFDSNTMVIDATNNRIGIITTNPISLLSNTASNIISSNNMGVSSTSFSWIHSGPGFIQAIYNPDIIGHGLNVKVRGNTSTINAFEVGQGTTATSISNSLLKVQGDGNLGITKASPTQQLHLGNTGSVTANKTYNGAADDGFSFNHYINTSGENGNSFARVGDIVVASPTSSSAGAGVLRFLTSTNAEQGGTITEKMRIHSNGNVGIGAINPQTTLHINHPLSATATINANASVLRLSRPSVTNLKWDNIAQFNLGSYSTAITSNSRLDLSMSNGDNNTSLTNVMTWLANGNVGIGTTSPTEKLEVTGNVKFSGALMPNNNPGTSGQFLVSNGSGNAPTWSSISTVSGSIAGAYYVQGSSSQNVNQGSTLDVPGVSLTLTVPAGRTQTFLFTIQGYAVNQNNCGNCATQGVFSLVSNGAKISSAYTSTGDGGLVNLPAPTTFLKSVTLSAGTYTFKVQYTAWSGNQIVNHNPTNYQGYNGDTECMLTKMQVLAYNN